MGKGANVDAFTGTFLIEIHPDLDCHEELVIQTLYFHFGLQAK